MPSTSLVVGGSIIVMNKIIFITILSLFLFDCSDTSQNNKKITPSNQVSSNNSNSSSQSSDTGNTNTMTSESSMEGEGGWVVKMIVKMKK